MVSDKQSICPECGGQLKYYDKAVRVVRGRRRQTQRIKIRRLRCENCGRYHRELPDFIFPYKQYDADVIRGVCEGFITPDTIGFEDYPCEMTMKRWKAQELHLL
ncbi:MAG: DUF6431 domain-containing protein [Lachnospiraceae bacterium]|nr:DUF6431 domain-containing protein [Lachnospiraceae bacterium]